MLKRWISNLNLALFWSTLPAALLVDWLVSVLLFVALICFAPWVALLVGRLASVLIFHALCSTTLRVTLLVFDFLNHSCFVLNTSTRSARCSVVSGSYLKYTLTFLCQVLLRFCPLWRSNFVLLTLHSPELLTIRPFCHRFESGFCLLISVLLLLLSSNIYQNPTLARRR